MIEYLRLLEKVMVDGDLSLNERTGVQTRSLFGEQLRFDLTKGFPILTTKKMFMKGIIHELLWFIQGSTNIRYLKRNGVSIWDAWADEEGELGPVYGKQLRRWGPPGKEVDQLADAIRRIREDPTSRRHLISLWNASDVPSMALPPCHGIAVQFYVRDGKLSCHMYQRSADMFLGVPFNISSYALLTLMVAQVTDFKPGMLVISFGDLHIYSNHVDQVNTQLSRTPKSLPAMHIDPTIKDIDSFTYESFRLEGYTSDSAISAPVAV